MTIVVAIISIDNNNLSFLPPLSAFFFLPFSFFFFLPSSFFLLHVLYWRERSTSGGVGLKCPTLPAHTSPALLY